MIFQDKQSMSVMQKLASLREQGYLLSFRREAACIFCIELQERILPEDFTVKESYYFEDILNPDADRILYALDLADGSRGCLVDSCNVYSDNISYEMEEKLQWNYPVV